VRPLGVSVAAFAVALLAFPAVAQSPSPGAGPSLELSARGEAQDDLFRLVIETPKVTYSLGEAIPLTTTLAYIGAAPSNVATHSGSGLVGFRIEQLDGPLDMGPAWTDDLHRTTFRTGDVLSVPFSKSGGWDPDGPEGAFWRAWFDDPLLRPPAGTFRIHALEEYGSGGRRAPTLTASVTVQVVDGPTANPGQPSPAAIDLPPVSAPPDVVLDAYLQALLAGDCATAHTLVTATFIIGNGELCGALTVTAARIDPVGPARPSDHEVVFGTTLTTVGGDASMPDGEQTWFYDLQRQPDGAWRLTGGGSGP